MMKNRLKEIKAAAAPEETLDQSIPAVETIEVSFKHTIKIKRLHDKAIVPTYGSAGAAGADLYACIDRHDTPLTNFYEIPPHSSQMISTGFAFEIPKGMFGAVYPRSGLACREGLRLANSTAIIDEDYRGELKIVLYNDSDEVRIVEHGQRIAQIIFQYYEKPLDGFEEVEELSATERAGGGFGSTGKN